MRSRLGASMPRAGLPVGLVLAAVLAAPATASSPGGLQQRIDAAHAHEHQLHAAIGADDAQIAGLGGRIADLQERLVGLESSLAVERRLLEASQTDLRSARGRLQRLKLQFAVDRRVLARQLVADYKADRPDVMTVVLNADGFADLLERMDSMRTVQRSNTGHTTKVRNDRRAVGAQTV